MPKGKKRRQAKFVKKARLIDNRNLRQLKNAIIGAHLKRRGRNN